MNVDKLIELVRQAVSDGLVAEGAGEGIDELAMVSTGRTHVSGLLSTYRRRSRLASNGPQLQRWTDDLIQFLEGYDGGIVTSVYVHRSDGWDRTFLADREGSRILFWMKMLDLPTWVPPAGSDGWYVRTWVRPAEVEPGSGVAEQLRLMQLLASGMVSAPEFARAWYAARYRSIDRDERVREPFGRLLDRVFFCLEDYPMDSSNREEGDLTDEELIAEVRVVLGDITRL